MIARLTSLQEVAEPGEQLQPADGSTRFVEPPQSPLVANLAAVWGVDPALARELEALGDHPAHATETGKGGLPTLAMKTADGRSIYLHSRFQPEAEAKRLVESAMGKSKFDEKMMFYVLGLGLGYHVQELWKSKGEEAMVCVFEPDLRMIWTALASRDFAEAIATRRLLFFWREDKADILARLTQFSALITMGAQTILHSASVQLHAAFFEQVQRWLEELACFVRTGMNTLVLNSAKTSENVAANLAWYAACPGIGRLKDRYKKQPAVIVSAGPSLRKNKHLLTGLDDKAVLIAVQTTLQPLVEMGVRPRFVTSLDYHEICSRFFEKLPADLRTELVAEPKATDVIFKLNPGPVTMLGNEFAESLLREVGLNKPRLPAGATVAHLAYYLAEHLGCDPIIFIGQDLGFSDGLCYSPGTSYEDVWRPELSRFCTLEMKQWEQIVREKHILRKIPDIHGRPMYTEERLFMYLQQFERDFGKSSATIIDATEGGALKRGAIVRPLGEVIEKYCTQPLEAAGGDDATALDWSLVPRCIESLEKRREEACEIGRISRQTLPLLEEIRDNLDDQPRVNRVIARLDQLRAEMDELGQTYDQVTQLTQKSELRRFERDRRVSASKTSGAERQKMQVERDIENVQAMVDASAAFAALMDKTIEKLRGLAPINCAEAA